MLLRLRDVEREADATRPRFGSHLDATPRAVRMAPAMHGVGDAWEGGTADVYQERRSCDLVEESLQEIGRLIAAPPANGPLALGGTLEHDGSRLATRMIELVLRQAGWRAHSIGAKLPAASLAAAVRDLHPQLVWVSVSHPGDFTTICDQLRTIRVSLPVGASMFVGGAGVDARLPRSLRTIEFGASLRELLARVRC